MAVNEKPVYAATHTSYGGRSFRPGERMDVKLADAPHALRSALESGVATDVASKAESAKREEAGRVQRVAEEIATRSEQRNQNRVKQLVRLPDGTYAEAS